MSNPITPTPAAPPQQTTPTPTEVFPTVEQVVQICRGAPPENVRKTLPYLLKAMAAGGLTSKNQLIAVLATIAVECAPFLPIREYGRGRGKSYGQTYFGRGLVQITWRENYQRAERDLGIVGLVANPDLALDQENAARILVWYWKGGPGNKSIVPYAESGDWQNVRSIVNAGSPGRWSRCHGKETFLQAIQRGKQILTRGIDPSAVGAMPVDGSYGLGCADPGAAGSRSLSHLNPQTQGNALAHALGITAKAMSRGIVLRSYLNPKADPRLLELDAQKTLEFRNLGGPEFDGIYTADDVVFTWTGDVQMHLTASQPDPNAPAPDVFLHDTSQGTSPSTPLQPDQPVPSGEIPARIFAAAQAARGRSSRNGPGRGNVACAWATNLFCILPSGLRNIGEVKGQDGVTVSVREMVRSLEGGRGQKIDREQAVPGDIWVSPRQKHIGIIMTAGATRVLSNSSSRAKFSWEDDIDNVNRFYGAGAEYGIYRVLN